MTVVASCVITKVDSNFLAESYNTMGHPRADQFCIMVKKLGVQVGDKYLTRRNAVKTSLSPHTKHDRFTGFSRGFRSLDKIASKIGMAKFILNLAHTNNSYK